MTLNSLTQVVIKPASHNSFLVTLRRNPKRRIFLCSSHFLHVYLVFYWAKFLIVIIKITFVLNITCCEVRSFSEADVNLTIPRSIWASDITRKLWTTTVCSKKVWCWTYAILSRILDRHDLFYCRHVSGSKKLFLFKSVRNAILVKVRVVLYKVVVSWRGIFVFTWDYIPGVGIHNIFSSGHTNTERWNILFPTIVDVTTNHYWCLILSWTNISLKRL